MQALSNQKYRELYDEFQDVGLMTGDVTINPSASALIMTTEVIINFDESSFGISRFCCPYLTFRPSRIFMPKRTENFVFS